MDRPLHIHDVCAMPCAMPIQPKQTFQQQQIEERECDWLTRRAWSVARPRKVCEAIKVILVTIQFHGLLFKFII
jgi:hypothetical protein